MCGDYRRTSERAPMLARGALVRCKPEPAESILVEGHVTVRLHRRMERKLGIREKKDGHRDDEGECRENEDGADQAPANVPPVTHLDRPHAQIIAARGLWWKPVAWVGRRAVGRELSPFRSAHVRSLGGSALGMVVLGWLMLAAVWVGWRHGSRLTRLSRGSGSAPPKPGHLVEVGGEWNGSPGGSVVAVMVGKPDAHSNVVDMAHDGVRTEAAGPVTSSVGLDAHLNVCDSAVLSRVLGWVEGDTSRVDRAVVVGGVLPEAGWLVAGWQLDGEGDRNPFRWSHHFENGRLVCDVGRSDGQVVGYEEDGHGQDGRCGEQERGPRWDRSPRGVHCRRMADQSSTRKSRGPDRLANAEACSGNTVATRTDRLDAINGQPGQPRLFAQVSRPLRVTLSRMWSVVLLYLSAVRQWRSSSVSAICGGSPCMACPRPVAGSGILTSPNTTTTARRPTPAIERRTTPAVTLPSASRTTPAMTNASTTMGNMREGYSVRQDSVGHRIGTLGGSEGLAGGLAWSGRPGARSLARLGGWLRPLLSAVGPRSSGPGPSEVGKACGPPRPPLG
jgi:hypothetical protein